MLKTRILLPNGQWVSSGAQADAAIFSTVFTQCVNSSEDLELGSVCSSMLELQILDTGDSMQLQQGQEIQVFLTDQKGAESALGPFVLEKPVKASAHMVHLTAYDRVSLLDRDMTQWLEDLNGWPYTLLDFAGMVCSACGLELTNQTIPNGSYPVQAFAAQGITGRKLMQWVGQLAGRFCRATPEGKIELAWYTPSDVELTAAGDHYFYQNGLSFEEYQVSPIEKVQLRVTQDDVGVVWPDSAELLNTYIISGNYLLTQSDRELQQNVAKTLYEQLKDVTYTPATVQIPAQTAIAAGHSVTVTDKNGRTVNMFVMNRVLSGQRDTLQCTGSCSRNSSTAVNYEDYRTLNHKMMELSKDAEGLAIKVSRQQKTTDEILQSVADVQVRSEELLVQLSQVQSDTGTAIGAANDSIQSLQKELTAKMTAEGVALQIKTALENGTDKVVTATGFTFDADGLRVEKTDSEMKTQITEDGMTVYRNDEEVLVANNNGVDAKNLYATTYLIVGGRSRFENYGSNRTGCFWIGG